MIASVEKMLDEWREFEYVSLNYVIEHYLCLNANHYTYPAAGLRAYQYGAWLRHYTS